MRLLIDLSMDAAYEGWLKALVAREGIRGVLSNVDYAELETMRVNVALSSAEFCDEQEVFVRELNAFGRHHDSMPPDVGAVVANLPTLFDCNLVELHKWLFMLDQTIRSAGDTEVEVFLPRAPTSSQIYLIEAEGETSKLVKNRVLYQRTDFLLYYLHQYCRRNARLVVRRYRSPGDAKARWLPLIRLIRGYGVPVYRALKHLLNKRSHAKWRREIPGSAPTTDASVCAVTRSPVHIEYMQSLLNQPGISFLICDNAFRYPSDLKLVSVLSGERTTATHLYDVLSFGDIVSCFGTVARQLIIAELKRGGAEFRSKLLGERYGVTLDFHQIVRESLGNSLEPLLVMRGLTKHLSANSAISKVLHCELFTQFPFYFEQGLRARGTDCIQVAFGTYELRPVPRFIWGDIFCSFSEQMREALQRRCEHFQTHIEYRGNLFIDETAGSTDRQHARANSRSIVFFTQPYDEENERKAIEFLRDWCREHGYTLHVALHPRDAADKYVGEDLGCKVWTHRELLPRRLRLLEDVAFAITRTSNVAYYLLLAGVPLINLVWSTHDATVVHEYYRDYPLLARDPETARSLLDRQGDSVMKFNQFREVYLAESWAGRGWQSFAQALFNQIPE